MPPDSLSKRDEQALQACEPVSAVVCCSRPQRVVERGELLRLGVLHRPQRLRKPRTYGTYEHYKRDGAVESIQGSARGKLSDWSDEEARNEYDYESTPNVRSHDLTE